VANSPRRMRELVVGAISDQPDIEVAGEIEEESGIETAVDQTQPDFLIVALDSGDRQPESCQAVLQNHPKVRSSWRGHPIPTAIFLRFTTCIRKRHPVQRHRRDSVWTFLKMANGIRNRFRWICALVLTTLWALAMDWRSICGEGLRSGCTAPVDREGRVSLPEVGPVFDRGKSLEEVQQRVQQLLRGQFRDVSAEVSLS
jgi:hypothetical protein